MESDRAARPLAVGAATPLTAGAPRAATVPARPSLVRGLSLLGCVALIVGNMVGTSIYTLPASLAKTTGPLGLAAWVLTAIGYFFVALIYASLGTRYPNTGGPYVFARDAWGLGYATEALEAMVDVARQTGIERLEAICHAEHIPSVHVLEKCSFVREEVRREHFVFPNLRPQKKSDVFSYVRSF